MTILNTFKLAAASFILLASGSAFAQISSGTGTDVALTATLEESLTVSLDQTAIDFTLSPGNAVNAGSTAVVATTTWNLAADRTSVKLFAYFDDAASALSLGAVNIASSTISATVGGVSAGNFTNAVPFGTGLTVFTQAITDANRAGSHESSVALNIDLSSIPQLPAGAYTGTLHFQAQATT
jgi:hypothetical protein